MTSARALTSRCLVGRRFASAPPWSRVSVRVATVDSGTSPPPARRTCVPWPVPARFRRRSLGYRTMTLHLFMAALDPLHLHAVKVGLCNCDPNRSWSQSCRFAPPELARFGGDACRATRLSEIWNTPGTVSRKRLHLRGCLPAATRHVAVPERSMRRSRPGPDPCRSGNPIFSRCPRHRRSC